MSDEPTPPKTALAGWTATGGPWQIRATWVIRERVLWPAMGSENWFTFRFTPAGLLRGAGGMLRSGRLDDALIVRIAGDDASLQQALKRSQQGITQASGAINRELNSVDRELGRVGQAGTRLTGVLKGIGAGLSIAAFRSFTTGALQAADAIGKAADRIGLGIEAYQEIRYAADLAGVSSEQLEEAMAQLQRRLAEGKLPYANTEQAIAGIADRLASTSDATEQARIVNDAFGESGRRLIPMLKDGSAGLAALRKEARDLNLVLDTQTVRSAEKLNDELSRLNQVIQANLAAGLLRGLTEESQSLADIYKNKTFQDGLKGVGNLIAAIAKDATDGVTSLGALLKLIDDPTWANAESVFNSIGAVSLVRRTAQGLGMAERDVKPADVAGGIDDDLNRFLPSTKKVASGQDEITSAAQKVIEALRLQQDQLKRTARDQTIYNQLQRAGVDINTKAGQQIAAIAGALYDQEEARRQVTEATKAEQEVLDRAAQITRDVESETETFARTQEELNKLLEGGYLTLETYNRALQDADPAYKEAQEAAKRYSEEAKRASQDATRAAERQAEEMERLAMESFKNALAGIQRSASAIPSEIARHPETIAIYREAIA
uniref:Putative tail protein n=1 Tax=viral metagenome TaxID=1070528 RepID=A0A6M3M523_9ZZZZ